MIEWIPTSQRLPTGTELVRVLSRHHDVVEEVDPPRSKEAKRDFRECWQYWHPLPPLPEPDERRAEFNAKGPKRADVLRVLRGNAEATGKFSVGRSDYDVLAAAALEWLKLTSDRGSG